MENNNQIKEESPNLAKRVMVDGFWDENDPEYYYLGKKILVQQNFTKKEDRPFDALYQAQSYLNDLGYSYGSLSVTSSPNVAVKKGEYDLPQKWHNFDKEEISLIDGVIRSHDYREGVKLKFIK
jgi:hypothetical protein